MKSIIISDCCTRQFLNYIEKNHKYAYEQIDLFRISTGEDKGTLIPYISEFYINYDDTIIYVEIKKENETPLYNGMQLGYLISIIVSNVDLTKLKTFVNISTNHKEESVGNIEMYHSRSRGYWEKSSKIIGQTLENIFLPQEVKDTIVKHIDCFIANKERYLKFGRVYKQCFLLTGVPGAGKSSLIKAIAMKYNRPIYALTLTKKLEDESLTELFSEVKENSIIVLEDIDAFFVDRQAQDINVSFSAILNLFDGLFSPGNGIILFMTGNNPERLDSALIRPGRVDKIIKFDYPKKREVNQAFDAIVGHSIEQFNTFYKSISGTQISMAGIVDYLFRHPEDYLDCINELNTHTQLLHEITDKNSQHLYK
jgi:ATP-dependent 26S proteasome regulatory subunit